MEELQKTSFEIGDTVYVASLREGRVIEAVVVKIHPEDILFLDKKEKEEDYACIRNVRSTQEEAEKRLEQYIEVEKEQIKNHIPILTLFHSWSSIYLDGQWKANVTAMKRALKEEYQIDIDALFEMQFQKEKEEKERQKELEKQQPVQSKTNVTEEDFEDIWKDLERKTIDEAK